MVDPLLKDKYQQDENLTIHEKLVKFFTIMLRNSGNTY